MTSVPWSLGPVWTDPGRFPISDLAPLDFSFAMASVFRLDWNPEHAHQEGIHNIIHAITLGSRHMTSKLHIENLAQILHGELNITSRCSDHKGTVHRNTQPLPGGLQENLGKWLLLVYLGQVKGCGLITRAAIYDYESMREIQCCAYQNHVQAQDWVIPNWDLDHLPCQHETMHQSRDHMIVHGNCRDPQHLFTLGKIWGSIGQDPMAIDMPLAAQAMQGLPSEIGGCSAWYACDLSSTSDADPGYSVCKGRYVQTHQLGISKRWFQQG